MRFESLQSRAHNVAHLPGYQNTHAQDQLRAAILCVHGYVRDRVAAGETRKAINANERVFKIATRPAGIRVFWEYGIDVFAAIDSRRQPRLTGDYSVARASAMRLTPSWTFCIEVAYDRRKKPGAQKPVPGTTATRPFSRMYSASATSSLKPAPAPQ
jgi:hypothetical protein